LIWPISATARGCRGHGKMSLLHSTHPRRQVSGLRGSLPTGTRKFGNILDPESEVSYILRNNGYSFNSRRNWEHHPLFLLFRRMITAIRNYSYSSGAAADCFVGDWRYYRGWAAHGVLHAGLNAYAKQFVNGLIVTGMSDQVSWGVYIANFTFLVGVAAAAVMMVIPVYIYDNEELHDLVIFGELLAVAAILMCLAFVTVDLGRPDRRGILSQALASSIFQLPC